MTASVRAFLRGFASPLLAARFLAAHRGLKRYAALPTVVNVVVYVVAIAVCIRLVASWDADLGPWSFWGGFGAWLEHALEWTLATLKWIVAIPLVLVATYFTFSAMGMVIASPFMDVLSDRVERVVTEPGDALSLPLRVTAANMVLGVLDALSIAGRQAVGTILVLPLLAVPLVGAIPLFLVGAWFTGIGFFDVSMARNNLRWRHKSPMIREHRWELLGLGTAMQLLFLVPFAGLLVLPLGAIAGTLLYAELDWPEHFARHGIAPPRGWSAPRARTDPRLPDRGA